MIKRNFCIGSEWLYYKLYTGVKTVDIILYEKLSLIISSLIDDKVISKWFFVRYKDPDDHIRIRLNCDDSKKITIVINKLYPVLNELLLSDVVWKIQTDTYQREIERYGENTIINSENIFYYDSEMFLKLFSFQYFFHKNENQIFFSLLAIDSFLNTFLFTISEKYLLLESLQTSIKNEFSADKVLKKELDKNYREYAIEINRFLKGEAIDEFPEIYDLISEKQHKIQPLVNDIKESVQVPLYDFLSSHIHMIINRQYTSRQRQYECLIYDHLFRYYKTTLFKINVFK